MRLRRLSRKRRGAASVVGIDSDPQYLTQARFASAQLGLDVDFREAPAARRFPRYVPCAITLLAAQLQILRAEVGTIVRVAANGAYRSPGHTMSTAASRSTSRLMTSGFSGPGGTSSLVV